MPATLAIILLAIIWSAYRMHIDPKVPQFNLLDLLMENNRVSKISCIMMGSFVVHSWIMIDLQVFGKMTEGYLTIYGATWVAPLITRIIANRGSGSGDN